jgi:tRNA threonylcarbamoyladenosine biosynthesis protein TsaE
VSSPAIERLTLALPDEGATASLAARLALLCRRGDVIALGGELGAGKTTFARGFIRALGDPAEEVPSPTFSLLQIYETASGPVWHFDLYRLKQPEEALELGLDEGLAEGILLIEWPERLGPLLPQERLALRLAPGVSENARLATIEPSGGWAERARSLVT